MKIFILDDDKNVIRILQKIIKDKELGEVVGVARDGKDGLEEIKATIPDIVLIDLLMPEIDGLTVVKELKKEYPNIEFIMISQVSSKNMVEQAYRHGVEYYIYKPINAIEVEAIIKKVIERIEINRSISKIQQIFAGKSNSRLEMEEEFFEQCVNGVLIKLGVMGEKGAEDIIDISNYIIKNDINLNQATIRELCSKFTDNPKAMEQRMRRTIGMAMSNIANLGIEDYMNEIFVEFSNTLFNFEQVRREMEYIRGKNKKGGSVNIKRFLAGLTSYCENINN